MLVTFTALLQIGIYVHIKCAQLALIEHETSEALDTRFHQELNMLLSADTQSPLAWTQSRAPVPLLSCQTVIRKATALPGRA